MFKWYVMQSKPQKEYFLYSQLNLHQIKVYLPLIKVDHQSGHSLMKPYFPGYLFTNLDISEIGMAIIKWMPGSKGIVCFGGQAANVPDYFISQLKDKLETINALKNSRFFPISEGSAVNIIHGPFTGYEAIFNEYLPSKDRVCLLLKSLSENAFPIEMPASHIKI